MTLHQPLWLADLAAYSFQVAVIVIVGSLLPVVLRLRVPNVRLIYWQALLGACLLLPLLEPWRALMPLASDTGQVSISMGPAAAVSSRWPISLADSVAIGLLAGILLRAAWILLGLRRLRRIRTQAKPLLTIPEPIQRSLSLTRGWAVILVSSDLASPATVGLRAPAVLLPESFFRLPPSQQTAIACHELLHVTRRDWLWNATEEIVLALLWFHPALWWVVRNIRLSREQTVDAEVVRRTQSRQAYLSALLEMARQSAGGVSAPLFLRESQLAERVALMVREVSMSRVRLATICVAAALILAFAGSVAVWAFPLRVPTGAANAEAIEGGGSIGSGTQARKTPHEVSVNQLKQVHMVMPHYPPKAKKAGVQGTVVLDATINKQGVIEKLKLISGPPELVTSAMTAVRQWRYAPSPQMPVSTRIEIHYTLAERKPAGHTAAGAGKSLYLRPSLGGESASKNVGVVYKPGPGVRAPVAIFSPSPPYSLDARKARYSGDVVLSVVISPEGRVSEVEVVKPLGLGLDENAVKTVRTWRFRPGERDGKPVPVRVLIDVTFHYAE